MLASLRQRLDREDDGFTLIELMVVVLIIAILIAIAIPTFLGVQNRAKDRAAQSNLRNALTAAKTIATDDAGEFDTVTVAALQDVEGSLTFQATASDDPNEVTVVGGGVSSPASANFIQLYAQSDSGEFFGIAASKDGEVKYCRGDAAAAVSGAGYTDGALTGCTSDKW